MFSFPSLFHRCKYCTNFLSETGLRKKAYLHACFDYIFFSLWKMLLARMRLSLVFPEMFLLLREVQEGWEPCTQSCNKEGIFFFIERGTFFPSIKLECFCHLNLKAAQVRKCLCWLLWTVSRGVTACTYMGNFIQKSLNEFKCWLLRSVKISGFAWPWQC